MCDPMTLAIVGTAVAVAGSAVSGVMAAKQANYEKAVANENRKRESARAADAIERGEVDQNALGRKYASMAGAQRAAMAANGIDISFGSAADTQEDTARFYREDASNLNHNISNEVKGIDISAANYGAQAKAAGMKATGAIVGAAFDVGSTIIGGIGKAGKISAAQKAGGSGW